VAPVNVRYIVDDVDAAIAFYTQRLGFSAELRPAPGFAIVSRGDLRLLLNAPTGPGGAAQPMPDGRKPEPGGGSTAYFASRRNAGQGKRFALQIYGSGGILEITTGYLPSMKYLADPAWSPGRGGVQWQDVSSAGIGQPEPLKDGGLHAGNVLAVKDLLTAIEENREPQSGVYEARGATEMIVAAFESQRTGGPVSLPLKNRENPLENL